MNYADYAYFERSAFVRIKKDGTAREIPLFSTGYLHLIDRLFWNLPFTSPKQAEDVRVKFSIPEAEWDTKWKQIVAEIELPEAREELRDGKLGWKRMGQAAAPTSRRH